MKTMKFKLLLVLISLCVFGVLRANNVDEIINKHIEAHGGAEKWEAVKAISIKATYTAFSEDKEFYALKTANGEYYADFHLGKHPSKEGFNGEKGWIIDPWHRMTRPRDLNRAESIAVTQKADFFSPFYKYKEKGYTVEYVGEQNVEGVDTYVLNLTRKNGVKETWYLDKNTYLEFKSESKWVDFASQADCETYFDDFREQDGIIFPFFTERMFNQRHRVLIIDELEINPKYCQSIFEMPKSEPMQKLAFMKGEWDVDVKMFGRNQKWNPAGKTKSALKFEKTNNIEQKLHFEYYYVQDMILNYSYHTGSKAYRLAVHNAFYNNTDFLEGNFIDDNLVFDNLKFKTDSEPAIKIIVSEIEENAFTIEMQSSRDNGENWKPDVKFELKK